jgi:RNA polymerase sigma-70 factor, ECF subfamily
MSFDTDLLAQIPVLRCYAYKLTHDREQARDLVQDTCESALRFRHLFQEGTGLRAWVVTIMHNRFLDAAKRSDAMVSGQRGSLEEWEGACSNARAEQICFLKEALRLAAEGLSKEQANVFWPTLGGASQEECAVLCEITTGAARTRLHRARSFMRHACAVSNEAKGVGYLVDTLVPSGAGSSASRPAQKWRHTASTTGWGRTFCSSGNRG